jgi:hypothetical protein
MSIYSRTILSHSPAGYWRLGESSGSTAGDSSGNARSGSYVGGMTLGVVGAIAADNNSAIILDGSSGYVSIPHNSAFNAGTFSVGFIIRFNPAASFLRLIGKWDGSNAWFIQTESTTGWGFYVQTAGGRDNITSLTSYDAATHQVLATYDGTTIAFYIDSVLIASKAHANPGPCTTNTHAILVGVTEGITAFSAAYVDEVFFCPTVLTAADALAIYNAMVAEGIAAPGVGGELIRRK